MRLDDEDNDTARIVELVFEPSIRELGRDHEWNCLAMRANVPQLATPPIFGYDFQYLMPIECIRVLVVNGQRVGLPTALFKVEGRNILTDANEMKLEYSGVTLDSTVYDTMFVEALAVMIASKIAIQIRQDEALAQAFAQRYLTVNLPRARKVDGNERNKAPYDGREQSRSLASRRTGTRNGSVRTD